MDNMKRYTRHLALSLVLSWSMLGVQAQVTISSMVATSGIYLKSQLWDLAIVNSYPNSIQGRISVSVKNIQTMQTILSGMSTRFVIPPGTKMVQAQYVQPVQYTYSGGVIADQSPNGVLPAGHYLVCYQLYFINIDAEDVASDDCIQVDVEPLSPLVLNFPGNADTLETLTPDFSWTPPAPSSMFSKLEYDFILTEVLNGQSATDAVQKNPPFQQSPFLQQPVLRYPIHARSLEKGKTYAWQIVARDQNHYTAKSEVWQFTIKNDSIKNVPDDAPYFRIMSRPLAPVFAANDIIKAEYHHDLPDSLVSLKIFNARDPRIVLYETKLNVRHGQNFLQYDLTGKFKLDEAECYEAQFITSTNKVFILRFYPKHKQ